MLRAASRLAPDDETALAALAAADPTLERAYLERSARIAPRDAQVLTRLGFAEESDGRYAEAENDLLRAHELDLRTPPMWALINFYARRDDRPHFVTWGRRYLEARPRQLNGFFRLALAVEGSAAGVDTTFGPLTYAQHEEFAHTLATEEDWPAATNEEMQAVAAPNGETLEEGGRFTSSLLRQNRWEEATEIWQHMGRNPRFSLSPARDNLLSNGTLALPFTEEGFDWKLNHTQGVETRQLVPERAVEFHFTGEEPEHAVILFQPVDFGNVHRFVLTSRFVSADGSTGSELNWNLIEPGSGRILQSERGSDKRETKQDERLWSFEVTDASHVMLALSYDRPDGAALFSGSINLLKVSLTPKP